MLSSMAKSTMKMMTDILTKGENYGKGIYCKNS